MSSFTTPSYLDDEPYAPYGRMPQAHRRSNSHQYHPAQHEVHNPYLSAPHAQDRQASYQHYAPCNASHAYSDASRVPTSYVGSRVDDAFDSRYVDRHGRGHMYDNDQDHNEHRHHEQLRGVGPSRQRLYEELSPPRSHTVHSRRDDHDMRRQHAVDDFDEHMAEGLAEVLARLKMQANIGREDRLGKERRRRHEEHRQRKPEGRRGDDQYHEDREDDIHIPLPPKMPTYEIHMPDGRIRIVGPDGDFEKKNGKKVRIVLPTESPERVASPSFSETEIYSSTEFWGERPPVSKKECGLAYDKHPTKGTPDEQSTLSRKSRAAHDDFDCVTYCSNGQSSTSSDPNTLMTGAASGWPTSDREDAPAASGPSNASTASLAQVLHNSAVNVRLPSSRSSVPGSWPDDEYGDAMSDAEEAEKAWASEDRSEDYGWGAYMSLTDDGSLRGSDKTPTKKKEANRRAVKSSQVKTWSFYHTPTVEDASETSNLQPKKKCSRDHVLETPSPSSPKKKVTSNVAKNNKKGRKARKDNEQSSRAGRGNQRPASVDSWDGYEIPKDDSEVGAAGSSVGGGSRHGSDSRGQSRVSSYNFSQPDRGNSRAGYDSWNAQEVQVDGQNDRRASQHVVDHPPRNARPYSQRADEIPHRTERVAEQHSDGHPERIARPYSQHAYGISYRTERVSSQHEDDYTRRSARPYSHRAEDVPHRTERVSGQHGDGYSYRNARPYSRQGGEIPHHTERTHSQHVNDYPHVARGYERHPSRNVNDHSQGNDSRRSWRYEDEDAGDELTATNPHDREQNRQPRASATTQYDADKTCYYDQSTVYHYDHSYCPTYSGYDGRNEMYEQPRPYNSPYQYQV